MLSTKFHSTETTLLSVHDERIQTMDKQKVTGLALLYLSAAFDTIIPFFSIVYLLGLVWATRHGFGFLLTYLIGIFQFNAIV